MRALKCDNCGEYYNYNSTEITKIAFCPPYGSPVIEKDICPECLAAVSKALEGRTAWMHLKENKVKR